MAEQRIDYFVVAQDRRMAADTAYTIYAAGRWSERAGIAGDLATEDAIRRLALHGLGPRRWEAAHSTPSPTEPTGRKAASHG